MTDKQLGDFGCTPERKRHSAIDVETREVTKGGLPISYGNRDLEHCYLDWLLVHRLLGNEDDSRTRYEAGYELREIYFRFRSSRRDLAQSSTRTGFLTEHETDSDKAEQEYHQVMRTVPAVYRDMLRAMCIGEPARFEINRDTYSAIFEACEEARDALDALHKVFTKLHREK